MPKVDMTCKDCGYVGEYDLENAARADSLECPECDRTGLRRIYSAPNIGRKDRGVNVGDFVAGSGQTRVIFGQEAEYIGTAKVSCEGQTRDADVYLETGRPSVN